MWSTSRLLFFFFATILACATNSECSASLTDKATGISFPPTKGGLSLFGVGVRKKAVINVYSVALYAQESLKEKLAGLSRSTQAKQALAVLRQGAAAGDAAFVLEMSFKVGAEKMANAIGESVAPRHSGSKGDVESLKSLIVRGLGDGGAAKKGTTFGFACSSAGVNVSVNGREQGNVPSAGLASAFCDVYLDDKCVSPALRNSCLEHCCAP